jgi:hypothetical protein
MALGIITLIVTSILLLIVARRAALRHRISLKWEGTATVLLTVAVFMVSYLPYVVAFVTTDMGVKYSTTSYRALYSLQNLNIMANFFVYAVTVRSFRQFLKLKISELKVLLGLRRISSVQIRREYLTHATATTHMVSEMPDTMV